MKFGNSNTGRGRLLRYGPFLLCAVLILGLSTGEASMTNTSRFVRPVLEFLFPGASEQTLTFYHAIIRKLAHLTEYAALGILASRAFRSSSRTLLNKYWSMIALVSALLLALVDEFFQSLNPSRTASFYDVALDVIGGILGIALFFLFGNLVSGIVRRYTVREAQD